MLPSMVELPARCPPERRRIVAVASDPVVLAIAVLTLIGLGLRLLYLLHDGFLLAVAEYDDGPYFGSAVRLTEGVLPYRDFVLVQPPGITLLMVPSALLAKVAGTAAGLASGRILTVLAGTASIPLAGLLVRHRGALTTVVVCGLMAVYPDAVAAAHTVLVEPWLVLFTVLGAVLMFSGDQLTAKRHRLAWAGVALGFAGAVEAWAIVPAAIMLAMCLMAPAPGQPGPRRPGRATAFAAGVATGFLVPVAPFAVASPSGFYRSLVTAQIGPRHGALRVGVLDRLYELTGLSDLSIGGDLRAQVSFLFIHLNWPLTAVVWVVTAGVIAAVAGGPLLLTLTRSHVPTTLEWFAFAGTWLVIAMLLWPTQFHYHFAAFLAPFLALVIALPLNGVLRSGRIRRSVAAGATALLILIFATVQARTESGLKPGVPFKAIAAAAHLIPPGSCAISDSVTMLLLAGRFSSGTPGCTVIDDGLGTDLAFSRGLTPATGASSVPAVAGLWRQSFHRAEFVWLSASYRRRIPFTTALSGYLHDHFELIYTDDYGDQLFRRTARRIKRP
jgi:alpha-1,2-mannosyltransferase